MRRPGKACRLAPRSAVVALLLFLPLSSSLAVDSEFAVIPGSDPITPLAELPETIVEKKFSPKVAAIPPATGDSAREEKAEKKFSPKTAAIPSAIGDSFQEKSDSVILIKKTNSH